MEGCRIFLKKIIRITYIYQISLIILTFLVKNLVITISLFKCGKGLIYVSKILKGKENMSLDTLSKLEDALGINLIYDEQVTNIHMVAECLHS